MTPNELRTFILDHPQDFPVTVIPDTDPVQYESPNGGDDQALALSVMAHPELQKEVVNTQLTEPGLFDAIGNAAVAESIMQKLETVAISNPTVARAVSWLKGEIARLNFGSQQTRDMIDDLEDGKVFTTEEATILKNVALKTPTITHIDISKALGRWVTV
jgi:hypothetical protein